MRSGRLATGLFAAVSLALCVTALSACHSYHIDATILNHTGGAVSLLEVDYPSASFGVDTLVPDGTYHYRLQTRDSGPVKVQYTAQNGHQVQITGPTLYEKQEGSIQIVLLPDGKAEFHPSLNPQH
jgi:hypothetical protein